jgi:ryanodine receptor 2
MKNYNPSPVDTSNIELPASLNPLVEKMAENVHDEWAKTRVEQGWTWGEKRDDANKKHPCLVPYAELPDDEKVYDRNTAVSTLKLIISMGFTISKG